METVVFILFIILAGYLTAGFLFALLFIFKGIEKVDAAAHASSWCFRIIIIPGIMALWPALLSKWIKKANHDKAAA